MGHFVGIDIGTSFIKAALIDLEGFRLCRTERAPFPEFERGKPPLHREVDPGKVVAAVEDLLRRMLAGGTQVDGLVLCGQMHGFVLVNGRGEAVSNYISWLDQRVTPDDFLEIAERIRERERNELGNELRASVSISVLYWLKRNGALPAGRVTPVSVADFVAGRLCGAMPAMEPTQAAAFGAMRIAALTWHEEVIGKLGLQSISWPEVRPTGSAVGRWRGAPCFVPVGDQQCALAGALLGERELSINIGTGSQLATITDTVSSGSEQTRPYFDHRFLRTITHVPAGRSLSALIRLLTEFGGVAEEDAWRRIDAAVRDAPSTNLRASLAFFPGPCGASGFLENIQESNLTVGHVFRAAFESMAGNYQMCAHRLDPEGKSGRVAFSGGVARRLELLRELIAMRLGLPWRLSPHPEDTLFGLMALALVCGGRQPGMRAATDAIAETLARRPGCF
jgi:sugar (pentulose or hexulose) kinase